jgi:antitoxin VapB
MIYIIKFGRCIMAHHLGKVFMNGRSQAIRLPKEFRFEVDEV